MLIPLNYVDDRYSLLDEMADLFSAQKPGWQWGVKRHLYAIEYAWALDQVDALMDDVYVDKRMLDAGGGRGAMMGLLAVRGAQVTTISRAADRMAGTTAGGVVIPDIKCLVGDMAETGLEEGSLDAITCISALEHNALPHIQRIVRHLVSLLKPGAPLVVTVPCGRAAEWHPRGTWPEMPTASDTHLFTPNLLWGINDRMGAALEHPRQILCGHLWEHAWDRGRAEMLSTPSGHRRPYLPGGFVLVRE